MIPVWSLICFSEKPHIHPYCQWSLHLGELLTSSLVEFSTLTLRFQGAASRMFLLFLVFWLLWKWCGKPSGVSAESVVLMCLTFLWKVFICHFVWIHEFLEFQEGACLTISEQTGLISVKQRPWWSQDAAERRRTMAGCWASWAPAAWQVTGGVADGVEQ